MARTACIDLPFFPLQILLVADGERLRMSLYRPREPRGGIVRFKLFRMDRPIPLSNILPVLENLGLHVVNERPYELPLAEERSLWIQDFDMEPAHGGEVDLDAVREDFEEAFWRNIDGDAGGAADLTDIWQKYIDSGEYSQGLASAFTFDGKVYAAPFAANLWVACSGRVPAEVRTLNGAR